MRFNKTVLLKSFALFLFCLGVSLTIFGSGEAGAISGAGTYFPNTSPDGQDASYAIVQVTGSQVRNSRGDLNANTKMKARTTVANIYVPVSLQDNDVEVTVVDGCHGTPRDNDTWAGDTVFTVFRQTDPVNTASIALLDFKSTALHCSGTDITMDFTAIESQKKFVDSGITYNVYYLFADGSMTEAGSSNRYLNAFGLSSSGGILVGISDRPTPCRKDLYPISCPTERSFPEKNLGEASWVYTSFYGPSSSSASYNQRILIRGECRVTGGISLYDLDASDTSLSGQTNLEIRLYEEGSPVTFNANIIGSQEALTRPAIANWESGRVPTPFGTFQILNPHPDNPAGSLLNSGGNNDEYMDIPGFPVDTMFDRLRDFQPGVQYELQINNISRGNAIQILPTITTCSTPDDSDISCSIDDVRVVSRTQVEVDVEIGLSGSAVVPAGTVDANGNGSGVHLVVSSAGDPSTWSSGNRPSIAPDAQDNYVPIDSGLSNLEYYDFVFSADGRTYRRYNIPNQQTSTFTATFRANVNDDTRDIVVRLLDRSGGRYYSYDADCREDVSLNEPPTGGIGGSGGATCSVSRSNRLTGQISITYSVSDPDGDTLTVNITSPVSASKSRNGNGTISFSGNDLVVNRRTNEYTVSATLTDGTETINLPSTTVTCPPPPNATCTVNSIRYLGSSVSSIDPLRDVLVDVDINPVTTGNTEAWPTTNFNRGLHVAITHRGNTNWAASGTNSAVSPSPDANSVFVAQDGITSEPLTNATFYDVPSPVAGRYQIDNPSASGNTTLRAQVPAGTGDYNLVIRMYDRAADTWLSNRCQSSNLEVELLPLSCTVAFNPLSPAPTEEFRTLVTMGNPNLVEVPITSADYFSDPDVISGSAESLGNVSAAVGGANGTLTMQSPEETIDDTGLYEIGWTVVYPFKGSATRSVDCPTDTDGNSVPPPTLSIRRQPYVKFYGNDIYAGGGFGQNCTPTSSVASAVSFMRENSAGYFQGASAELAIFAVDTIQGIRPGAARTPSDITELAFANTGPGIPSNVANFTFGGGFGQTICSEDYWSSRLGTDLTPSPALGGETYPSVNLSDFDGDQQRYIVESSRLFAAPDNRLTVYADGPLADGTRITLYVDGDVVIGRQSVEDTEIRFDNDSWTDQEDIPTLYIIARGNIYIDDTITELNGVFVAQPTNDAATEGGEIHTCSFYNLGVDLVERYAVNQSAVSEVLATECNNQLLVNGAFVARNIELLRTNGFVFGAPQDEPYTSSNIAEVFRFNPLLYLTGGDGVPADPDSTKLQFESILSLPPSF